MFADKTFVPEIYNIGGEYFLYHLKNDGLSSIPSLTKIKESALESVHGYDAKRKAEIASFVGFTISPENNPEKYQRTIDLGDRCHNFNLYELPFHPQGKHHLDEHSCVNWPYIYNLILHIAPNVKPFPSSKYTYFQLLLDYLAIAWRDPQQRLPILSIISKERSTGKTTFLQLIGLMGQSNAKFVSMSDLSSDFNFIWGLANFILVDEAKIPKNMMTKIRNESTSRSRNINIKFLQQFNIPNFSKYIMASNDIENFAYIQDEENRYFVIEVNPFPIGAENPNYLEFMKNELPYFLNYLMDHHQFFTKKEGRFWFNYKDYRTPALTKIINGSKSPVDLKVEELLEALCDQYSLNHDDSFIWEFCLTGIRNSLMLSKANEGEIKNVFKRLGIHCDDYKKRFFCAYSQKETNAIRYHVSVAELRSIFDSNKSTLVQANENEHAA